MRNKELRIRTV